MLGWPAWVGFGQWFCWGLQLGAAGGRNRRRRCLPGKPGRDRARARRERERLALAALGELRLVAAPGVVLVLVLAALGNVLRLVAAGTVVSLAAARMLGRMMRGRLSCPPDRSYAR